jgi:hypothetical protein
MADDESNSNPGSRRVYTWPWWALGALLLTIGLAILWMSKEIARTRMLRDLNAPSPPTNHAGPDLPTPADGRAPH